MAEPLVQQLEQLRTEARLAQRHVATLVGVSSREYTNWLTDFRRPTTPRMDRIRTTIQLLQTGLRSGALPILGHGRGTETARRRDAYVDDALKQLQNSV